jgi:hypothetical protein
VRSRVLEPLARFDMLIHASQLAGPHSAQHGVQEFKQSLRPSTIKLKSQTTARAELDLEHYVPFGRLGQVKPFHTEYAA